jgi:hypothetical protein
MALKVSVQRSDRSLRPHLNSFDCKLLISDKQSSNQYTRPHSSSPAARFSISATLPFASSSSATALRARRASGAPPQRRCAPAAIGAEWRGARGPSPPFGQGTAAARLQGLPVVERVRLQGDSVPFLAEIASCAISDSDGASPRAASGALRVLKRALRGLQFGDQSLGSNTARVPEAAAGDVDALDADGAVPFGIVVAITTRPSKGRQSEIRSLWMAS